MISTSQEETIAGNTVFVIQAATFGVKIHRYHADNGRLSEKPFKSAIGYFNHTITFCSVGSHHENTIVERKIKYLTLGAGTLLLHAKIYWIEAIDKILWTYTLKSFQNN